MGLNLAIVGLPNVGKSTLFNALTANQIDAANYPFCTIEPNLGMVGVPDERLDELAKIVNPEKVLPTTIAFVDIAGLVKGASKGEGLGNQFLANIRETDAIVHVVRCFENPDVVHVEGQINPIDDIETINTELALADLETMEKAIAKTQKTAKSGQKDAKILLACLTRVKAHLDEGKPVRTCGLSKDDIDLIKPYCFLTLKPVLYVANTDEAGLKGNAFIEIVNTHAQDEDAKAVVICAAIEAELSQLEESEKQEYLNELDLQCAGLDLVIKAGYDLLHLQTFFTAGVKEVRAWTVVKEALAPMAAGVIHTDFEKGFIKAEVISYEDFITYKGEHGAKEAGKLRVEGKQYITKDGDVMHFRFNV